MASSQKPWDQREGESNASYARFWAFLSLGPERTLAKAQKGPKTPAKRACASGNWKEECKRWDWRGRALAWDVERFRTIGYMGIKRLAEAIQKGAEKAIASLKKIEVENWSQFLETLHVLSSIIPPEVLKQVLSGNSPWQDGLGTEFPGPNGVCPHGFENRAHSAGAEDIA